jgi:hypothetical protein
MYFLLFSSILGCVPEADPPPSTTPTPQVGEGLFREGCPTSGQATARVIGVDESLRGQRPVGTRGDYLLMNDRTAVVITAPDTEKTFFYYGGIIADAAAVDNCRQVTDDKLDEVGLVIGDLDLGDRTASSLRAFRGETIEVLSDGADGSDAVVRVTGVDDTHWLVDYELQKEDPSREFNRGLHASMTVDYILAPDSQVVEIAIQVEGSEESPDAMLGAALITFGDTLDVRGYASDRIDILGLNLRTAMPWIVASDGSGAYAFAVKGLNLGFLNIGGIDIAIDVDQGVNAPIIPGSGAASEYGYFFAVGASDGNSATTALHTVKDEPTRSGRYDLVTVSGTVEDESGPVSGAVVELLATAPGVDQGVLDVARSSAGGLFSMEVPVFEEEDWSFATRVSAPGRDTSGIVGFETSDGRLELAVGGLGTLSFDITDSNGLGSPARVHLWRDDGYKTWEPVFDTGSVPVAPGTYSVTVSRGYEYEPVHTTLTIPVGGEVGLVAVLERVVDTSGYLSTDTHIHSDPSPDSRVMMSRQLAVAAGHGLEIPMSTDHEIIVGFHDLLAESPLSAVMGTVGGEEMTAVMPEHMTIFPVQPDGTARGGPVKWFGLDFEEVLDANRDRAEVTFLNHPGYLNEVGWDRVLGQPTLTDSTLLGWPEDAVLFDWNFDGVEVMNGNSSPFMDGNHRFDDWMSFVNHGHRMTGVGASDDHNGQGTGYPRTYVAMSTDDPTAFDEDEYVDAMVGGRAFISAGAFLRVNIGDATLGDDVTAVDGAVEVGIKVEALPDVQVTEVVVFVNCDEAVRIPTDNPAGIVKLDTEVHLALDVDSHIVVAAFSDVAMPAYLESLGDSTPRAMTNPIYVDVDEDGTWQAPGGKECEYF